MATSTFSKPIQRSNFRWEQSFARVFNLWCALICSFFCRLCFEVLKTLQALHEIILSESYGTVSFRGPLLELGKVAILIVDCIDYSINYLTKKVFLALTKTVCLAQRNQREWVLRRGETIFQSNVIQHRKDCIEINIFLWLWWSILNQVTPSLTLKWPNPKISFTLK